MFLNRLQELRLDVGLEERRQQGRADTSAPDSEGRTENGEVEMRNDDCLPLHCLHPQGVTSPSGPR